MRWTNVFSFLFIAAIFLLPTVSSAQIVTCNGPDCDWAALLGLGQNILNFLITIGVVISAGAFAYAGFLMFSDRGNTDRVKQAKDIIFNVVVGLIILLTAWLVINTILVTLTGKGLDERSAEVESVNR